MEEKKASNKEVLRDVEKFLQLIELSKKKGVNLKWILDIMKDVEESSKHEQSFEM